MKILIAGTGNVAHYLTKKLNAHEQLKVWNWGRDERKARTISSYFDTEGAIKTSDSGILFDLIILAVADSAVAEVSKLWDGQAELIAHTAGAVHIEQLKLNSSAKAVFYPLQTFSKNQDVKEEHFHCIIEAEKKEHITMLSGLAKALGMLPQQMDSAARLKAHFAAVLVNNFANHLFFQAYDFLQKENIKAEILLPLITETAAKIKNMHPKDAQTGPALRNDIPTLQQHIKLIEGNEEIQEIYELFTRLISKTYQDVQN
jgi:predicted short-subunit dehydrogenase-like oxidoreductase (DUF2520 family)